MIPEDIYKRWSSLWPIGHVPTRPWWTGVEVIDPQHPSNTLPSGVMFGLLEGTKVKASEDTGWRVRCDGRRVLTTNSGKWVIFGGWEAPNEGERLIMPKMTLLSTPDKPEGLDTEEDAMALVDQEYPLPAPEPMPGQVWLLLDGNREHQIARVHPIGAEGVNDVWRIWAGGLGGNRSEIVCLRDINFEGGSKVEPWPPKNAILVAGPGPWGRDIPWMKAPEVKP